MGYKDNPTLKFVFYTQPFQFSPSTPPLQREGCLYIADMEAIDLYPRTLGLGRLCAGECAGWSYYEICGFAFEVVFLGATF
jgi:hypothetical protein